MRGFTKKIIFNTYSFFLVFIRVNVKQWRCLCLFSLLSLEQFMVSGVTSPKL